jgi:hypothetical protein
MGSPGFDPYHKWLGIPPEDQPPSHYRLLGIKVFESDLDVIAIAADKQMAHVRTFQTGQYSNLSQKILNEVAAARVALLNPDKKRAYDAMLRRQMETAARTAPLAPPSAPPSASPPAPLPVPDWRDSVQQVVSSSAMPRKAAAAKPRTQQVAQLALAAAVMAAVGLAAVFFLKTPHEPAREANVAAEPRPTPPEPKPAAVTAPAKPATVAKAETRPAKEAANKAPAAATPSKPAAEPIRSEPPIVSEDQEADTASMAVVKGSSSTPGPPELPDLPRTVRDAGLTRALNDFSQWRIERGTWRDENGSIVGSGDSALCFNRSLPERFVLDLTMNVREGMRPRMRFTDFYVGNEGYSKVVSIYGTRGEAVGPGFEYQNRQEMKLRIVADGEELKLFINGSLVKQASREKAELSTLKIEGGDFWSKGTTSFSHFSLGRIPGGESKVAGAKATKADEATGGKSAAKKSPAAVLALLRKKLHAKVTYSSKTGYFALMYDWNSKQQLQDFDLHNAKVSFTRGSLALQAGESARHVVDFKEVALAAPVLVPEMRGVLVRTTGGAQARLGGQWPDTIYLEGGGGDDPHDVVSDKVRKGIQPIQVTVTQTRLGFLYGSGKPSVLTKPVVAFHAGQVELFGGDKGFQYGKLVVMGMIDDVWLESFAGEE